MSVSPLTTANRITCFVSLAWERKHLRKRFSLIHSQRCIVLGGLCIRKLSIYILIGYLETMLAIIIIILTTVRAYWSQLYHGPSPLQLPWADACDAATVPDGASWQPRCLGPRWLPVHPVYLGLVTANWWDTLPSMMSYVVITHVLENRTSWKLTIGS